MLIRTVSKNSVGFDQLVFHNSRANVKNPEIIIGL